MVDVNETGFTEEVVGGDVLDTPALELPKATSEVHHGTVESVTTKVGTTSGNTFGVITLKSKETGLTYEFTFFPPQAWFDGDNWGPQGFDASVLSDEPAPGKKMSPQQLFARSVASKDAAYTKDGHVITEPVAGKDAPLQLLKKLAALDGLTVEPGTPRPTNGDEYIGVINSLVGGRLNVIFTRTPQKNDNPAFDGRLGVSQILAPSEEERANFAKRFQNYRIMWQE